MVYTHDSKSCLARDVGSTPTPGTQNKIRKIKNKIGRYIDLFCFFNSFSIFYKF